jgi:LPPG:FO 2-phospho-L-lactate transferase
VLAGGTGGAKLARGLLDVVGPDELAVIANTADDIEIYGARVSPDPDLVTFWLADRVHERGWGLRGDTFQVMGALRDLGVEVWFQLGDRDLAWCMERRRMEDDGATPTEALRVLARRLGVRAEVLPMSDGVLRTFVNDMPLQEFLIRAGGQGPIREVRLEGVPGEERTPTPEVLSALARARVVIIGPSNPVISVSPILSTIGKALQMTSAPVVAVSPVVAGKVLKGPTAAFLSALQLPTSAAGVAAYYESLHEGLLDGLVADEPVTPGPLSVSPSGPIPPWAVPTGLATLGIDTRMADPASRARVADQVLAFAESLAE